jgi:hypothetical protein
MRRKYLEMTIPFIKEDDLAVDLRRTHVKNAEMVLARDDGDFRLIGGDLLRRTKGGAAKFSGIGGEPVRLPEWVGQQLGSVGGFTLSGEEVSTLLKRADAPLYVTSAFVNAQGAPWASVFVDVSGGFGASGGLGAALRLKMKWLCPTGGEYYQNSGHCSLHNVDLVEPDK